MLEGLVEKLTDLSGTVLFIGDTDTGKTTLCHKTAKVLLEANTEVALVDADIGQSSLFLPATVSAKVLSSPVDLTSRQPDYVYFVGLWNPALSLQTHIEATVRAWRAVKDRARVTIIDTTGLIRGSVGFKLKTEKIRRLNPAFVVAIQRTEELSHILKDLPKDRVITLRPNEEVKTRPRTQRIQYRNSLYRQYFSSLYMHHVPADRVRHLYRFTPRHQRGLLCGLLSGGRTRGLGVVDEFSAGGIEVLSPVEDRTIERCIIGGVFLDESIYL